MVCDAELVVGLDASDVGNRVGVVVWEAVAG